MAGPGFSWAGPTTKGARQMPFDATSFINTKFEPRTKDIPVPDLKKWFPKKEKPVWKIRVLTGAELGQAEQAAENKELSEKIYESLLTKNSKDVADRVKELVGQTAEKPASTAKRLYHIHYASIDPVCPFELAVKLCDNYPVLFYAISNAILVLSGQGNLPGK
jgi:hypothetical protein